MARATPPSKTRTSETDAVALLKQDHSLVSDLFDQVEDADGDELQMIAEHICQLLTVHAQIEEELLYPAAMESLDEANLVHEAIVEHASAKELIAKIKDMSAADDEFKATVTVLGEYVKHHVREEEHEIFPQLKKTDLDLKELGRELMSRKMELMQELGIEEEADKRLQKRAAAGARSRSRRAASGNRAGRKA